jgi:phosphohistidine phosphatase
MELLIVRHAIAEERSAQRWPDDTQRALSAQGLTRARRAAQGLKRIAPRPVRVLASPLMRTQQTAAILSQFGGWPAAVRCEELEPGAPPQTLLKLLAGRGEHCIGVVGHEPDLGRLLALCLNGSSGAAPIQLRKMGAALVSFEGRARAGQGALEWLLSPKILRAVRRLPSKR